MIDRIVEGTGGGQPRVRGVPSRRFILESSAFWSFVYIFFTNGIPFDAPNRSEPCPLC